jgi:hypothetical protein
MNPLRRFAPRILVGLAVVSASAVPVAMRCGRGDEPLRTLHPFAELHVPRVDRPIPIDAEFDGKKVWESDVGSTGVFKDKNGLGMVPYTEARARWGDGTLYLWLYAGDLDLEGTVREADGPVSSDDSFHIELGNEGSVYTIDVSVLGTVADARCEGAVGAPPAGGRCDPRWQSGAVVAVDRDGTLNQVGDNDEEWVVEMAVPLASLGLKATGVGTRVPFSIRRCEIARSGPRACGGFGTGRPRGELVFDAAPVESSRLARATAP